MNIAKTLQLKVGLRAGDMITVPKSVAERVRWAAWAIGIQLKGRTIKKQVIFEVLKTP